MSRYSMAEIEPCRGGFFQLADNIAFLVENSLQKITWIFVLHLNIKMHCHYAFSRCDQQQHSDGNTKPSDLVMFQPPPFSFSSNGPTPVQVISLAVDMIGNILFQLSLRSVSSRLIVVFDDSPHQQHLLQQRICPIPAATSVNISFITSIYDSLLEVMISAPL